MTFRARDLKLLFCGVELHSGAHIISTIIRLVCVRITTLHVFTKRTYTFNQTMDDGMIAITTEA